MAHRALVAYRDGDRYRLHYAHWGGGLADAVTPRTPFGGATADTHAIPDHLADRFDLDAWDRYTAGTRVEPRPLAVECDAAAVLATVDASFDSLVVVDSDFTTHTFLVCSLDVDGEGPTVVAGPTDDLRALEQAVLAAKERLGAHADAGALSATRARRALRALLERRVGVYPLDDASFLPTG